MRNKRVLIVDDHPVVREGIRKLLSELYDIVGIVQDGDALIEQARKFQPDVIVTDFSMPNLTGVDAIRQVKKENLRCCCCFIL